MTERPGMNADLPHLDKMPGWRMMPRVGGYTHMSVSQWDLVFGLKRMSALRPLLRDLAARCGQGGALDFLDYTLAPPHRELETTHNFLHRLHTSAHSLKARRSKLPCVLIQGTHERIEAAAFFFEYRLHGTRTGIFVPVDGDGFHSVIASPERRAALAIEAGEFLVKSRALLALVSHMEEPTREGDNLTPVLADPTELFRGVRTLVAAQARPVSRKLPLADSFDATLAVMGAHTRRNLRAFHRRAVKELGAVFVPRATMSLTEFLALNGASLYPATDSLARLRYKCVNHEGDVVFAGLRAADGRWLSVIGGYFNQHTVYILWQMNLNGFGSLSLVNAMRAFFIADSIERGMRWIRFEDGTTHSIHGAFLNEQTRDLIFARKFLPVPVLAGIAARMSGDGGPLARALGSQSLVWRV